MGCDHRAVARPPEGSGVNPASKWTSQAPVADAATSGRVLVVDDDPALLESVARALTLRNYDVSTATDGLAALEQATSTPFDAIVLDLGLPGADGIVVCELLRSRDVMTPILILTARHEIGDRVQGLDAGADDFMTKPFALAELFARIRALTRRSSLTPNPNPASGSESATLTLGELEVVPASRQARFRGERLDLTKTEFDILHLLVSHPDVVLDRSTIYDRVWGYDFGPDSKNLTVYIGYLRQKLRDIGAPEMIYTVRGVGYTASLER